MYVTSDFINRADFVHHKTNFITLLGQLATIQNRHRLNFIENSIAVFFSTDRISFSTILTQYKDANASNPLNCIILCLNECICQPINHRFVVLSQSIN